MVELISGPQEVLLNQALYPGPVYPEFPDKHPFPYEAGQMIFAHAGQTLDGWLECDGSLLDPEAYPELAEKMPIVRCPQVIDLGFFDLKNDGTEIPVGELFNPVSVKINNVYRHFYFLRTEPTSLIGLSYFTSWYLSELLNNGAPLSEDPESYTTTIDGYQIRLLGLGADFNEAQTDDEENAVFPLSGISSPDENQTIYDEFLALREVYPKNNLARSFQNFPLAPQLIVNTGPEYITAVSVDTTDWKFSSSQYFSTRTLLFEVLNVTDDSPRILLPDTSKLFRAREFDDNYGNSPFQIERANSNFIPHNYNLYIKVDEPHG